jgi:sporulation protein YqfC
MGKKKRINAAMAYAFDIPEEIACKQSKIMVWGNDFILIENYGGLIHYSPTNIICRAGEMEILLQGDNFAVKTMERDELIIQGAIKQINFYAGDENS